MEQRCSVPDCRAVALGDDVRCFGHTKDTAAVQRGIDELESGRLVTFTRGLRIGGETMHRISNLATDNPLSADFTLAVFEGDARFVHRRFGRALFNYARFEGDVYFDRSQFMDDAAFKNTVFEHDGLFGEVTFRRALFNNARFEGGAYFDYSQFMDDAAFKNSVFEHDGAFGEVTFRRALFNNARFEGGALFLGCKFGSHANFMNAIFRGEATFPHSIFGGDADFGSAAFEAAADFKFVQFGEDAEQGRTDFSRARFEGRADFDHASMIGRVFFDEAALSDRVRLTRVTAAGRELSLRDVTFQRYVDVRVESASLDCSRTRFLAGGQIRASGTSIILDEAQFPTPVTIASVIEPPTRKARVKKAGVKRARVSKARARKARKKARVRKARTNVQARKAWVTEAPAVVRSLRRADVGNLLLSGVDLSDCRFSGARNLDRLRVEAPMFAFVGWRLGFARRRLIAEEVHWRRARRRSNGWHRVEGISEADEEFLAPSVIASIYRSLRKGREDSKDEPGAADFYYGEMEMRRHDDSRSGGERLGVVAYWLLSGYGLRASRSLAALALVLLFATASFDLCGFAFPQDPYGSNPGGSVTTTSGNHCLPDNPKEFAESVSRFDTWVFATSAALAVIPRPEVALTTQGQTIRLVLRILGPLLIGLAFLSLRGRVKR